ncbi:MAG TPA: triose-phosphate isomerase [Thermoanaerobaculia bacterium]|nr:triose-phosphate isomerase [Thermoanaerobaculia bacterium]
MFKRYLVANWKMNLPPGGMLAYLDAVGAAAAGDVQVVVAPPFPYLRDVSSRTRLGVAAQNCADHEKGAFTGEVAPSMVRDCGAHYAIVGHSERRQIYGESDALVAKKVAAAAAASLVPILCIGEELRTRDGGHVATFLAAQLRAVAEAGLEEAGEIVIAYEPVWAIGTGRNASGLMIAETVELIRDALKRFWPPRFGTAAPILYGGSVTPENVAEMETSGHVDGYLVGGASLDSSKFSAILRAMHRP